MKKQDFTVLKIKDLHPFHLVEDKLLMELSESIKEFGVVTPIITRPKEDGNGYEVIAGQRRVRASQLAGIETIPAFVLSLDRDRRSSPLWTAISRGKISCQARGPLLIK